MADFRKLAIDLVAADGQVDEAEIKFLKKALYADGKIDDAEIAFLIELKAAVVKKTKETGTPAFDKFFLKALTDNILADGTISAEEAATIKKYVVGDKKIDPGEVKKFLAKLKKDAKMVDPAFDALLAASSK
jgi:uncharacterized tellurite resistance protein B-like protein